MLTSFNFGLSDNSSNTGISSSEISNSIGKHIHNYIQELIEPTCTEEGYTCYKCECGSSFKDKKNIHPQPCFKVMDVYSEQFLKNKKIFQYY